jgi:flagellar protein FliO/FliZ
MSSISFLGLHKHGAFMQSQFRYRIIYAYFSFMILLGATPALASEAMPSAQSTLIAMLVPLVLVTVAMVLALVLVRRRFRLNSNDGPMKVRQILAVGPRERVVMIDVDQHTLVIGVSATQVSQLALLSKVQSDANDSIQDEQAKS